jgi:hypothetical protein
MDERFSIPLNYSYGNAYECRSVRAEEMRKGARAKTVPTDANFREPYEDQNRHQQRQGPTKLGEEHHDCRQEKRDACARLT